MTANRYPDADGGYAFTPVPAIGVDGSATSYVVASDNTAVARQDLNVWTVNSSGVVTLSGEVPVPAFPRPPTCLRPRREEARSMRSTAGSIRRS